MATPTIRKLNAQEINLVDNYIEKSFLEQVPTYHQGFAQFCKIGKEAGKIDCGKGGLTEKLAYATYLKSINAATNAVPTGATALQEVLALYDRVNEFGKVAMMKRVQNGKTLNEKAQAALNKGKLWNTCGKMSKTQMIDKIADYTGMKKSDLKTYSSDEICVMLDGVLRDEGMTSEEITKFWSFPNKEKTESMDWSNYPLKVGKKDKDNAYSVSDYEKALGLGPADDKGKVFEELLQGKVPTGKGFRAAFPSDELKKLLKE